jgi:hypothetical protein
VLGLALALQLLGVAPATPEVHLDVPRLTLDGGGAVPDLAPEPPGAAPASDVGSVTARPGRLRVAIAAAAGVAAGDLLSAVPLTIGLVQCASDIASYGSTGGCARGVPLLVVGAVLFVVLPPATGLWGARLAGEEGDAGGATYGLALAARLGGVLLASAMGPVGPLALAATELVLTPWLIARTLGAAPPRAPQALALPVRDPALALR